MIYQFWYNKNLMLSVFFKFEFIQGRKHNQKEYNNVLPRPHSFCLKNLCKRIEIHYLISHSLRFKSNIAFSIKYAFRLNSLEHYLDILCNLVYSTNLLTTEAWHRKLGIKCSSRVFYFAAFAVFSQQKCDFYIVIYLYIYVINMLIAKSYISINPNCWTTKSYENFLALSISFYCECNSNHASGMSRYKQKNIIFATPYELQIKRKFSFSTILFFINNFKFCA